MKNAILNISIGIVLGILLSGFALYLLAPKLMIIENESKYSSFDETVEVFEKSVIDHDWKIPTTHDLQKTMAKYGMDVKAVKIFELCNPEHAGMILQKDGERIVSSLMPCRVAIYERSDGKVYFSRMNSGLMVKPMYGIIPDVMAQASFDNEEILKAIMKK
jgi:uncharacterized protein (DUF302 family)